MSEIADLERRYSLFEQGLLDEEAVNLLRQDVFDEASRRDIDLFEDQRTTSGQLYESGKGVARGFLGSFATLGEGLGEQADAITNKLGFEDLIDSGEENELVRMSRAAQESIQERLGADVAYRDQWLTKFGEGAGSFASFLVPGGGLKLLGAGNKIAAGVTATQAAGVGAGEQAQRIERAREQGIDVSQEQEDSAILWGSGVGLTELAPVHRVLSRITKAASPAFKKGIANKIKGALVSGGVEGVQEVAASIMQDAVERGVYNEELPFNDSLMDDFTVGGAVGAVADLALTAAAGRSGRKRNLQVERDLRTSREEAKEVLAGEVTEGQEQEKLGADTPLPEFVVEDDVTPDELIEFQRSLDKEMKGAGLSDVKANISHALRNVLRNRDGNIVFGIRQRREGEQDVRTFGGQSNIVVEEGPQAQEGETIEGIFSDAAGQIFIAADALPKEGTLDEQRDSAVGILKHEQLHAMRAMDLFTDAEWRILTNAVSQKNKKGTDGSYMDWAAGSYDNLSPVELTEEAVAEMTRDLRTDKTIITGKPRTLLQRIIDFFPKLNNFVKGRGYTTFDSLIRDIDAGKIGGRKRGEVRTLKNLEDAGSVVRQPDFDTTGAINQEREEDFPAPLQDAASIRKDDTGAERLNFLTQRLAFVRGSLEQDTDMYPVTRRKLEREARHLSDELRGLNIKDKYSLRKDEIAALREEANVARFGEADAVDTSYRLQHTPAKGADEETVRLDDLTRSISKTEAGYPDDFYSPEGKRIYSPGARFADDEFGKANDESYSIIMSSRGKPDKTVTMYRAVPKGITQINEGDFVTLSPTYAEMHSSTGYGETGQESGDVISKQVKVKDLVWAQDDVNEFGYFPEAVPEIRDKYSIRAYHGSPYDFDRFSSDKIGTGEGVQAYSRGLYLAESEDVAKSYRDNIPRFRNREYKGILRKEEQAFENDRSGVNTVFSVMELSGLPAKRVIESQKKELKSNIETYKKDLNANKGDRLISMLLEDDQSFLKEIENLNPEDFKLTKGRMYEVDIDVSPDELLDWDLPLYEQSEYIQNILRKNEKKLTKDLYLNLSIEDLINAPNQSGEGLYSLMRTERRGEKEASEYLRSLGIKGVRYKDAFSRDGEGGTSNYVMFDDSLIDIKDKYSRKVLPLEALPKSRGEAKTLPGAEYFKDDAFERIGLTPKSRETLIVMSPENFLSLANEAKEDSEKLKPLQELREKGQKFGDVPFLEFVHDGEGKAKVTGHEGRHRMMALQEVGVPLVPVMLLSGERGKGRAIRWGSQDPASSQAKFDYVSPENFPVTLEAQEKAANPNLSIRFPVSVSEAVPEIKDKYARRIKSLAEEQGFDVDNFYYHATAASRPIKKFRSDLPNISARNAIAGHFTLKPGFAETFLPAKVYEDGKDVYSMDEGDSPAIYPVYLRAKNSFDAGKIYREGPTGQTTGQIEALLQEIGDDSHPYYREYEKNFIFYDREKIPEKLAEQKKYLEHLVDELVVDPEFNYSELETLAPFIRSAGYDSYIDYENSIADPATGIAMFDPSDIKGVFAQYDPSGVPEGYEYADDIMFSRRKTGPREELTKAIANTELLPNAAELEQMKNGTYKPEKKRTLVEAVQFLQDRWEAATGRTEPFEYTPENMPIISDILASEALVALGGDSNAIGWYDRKIKDAKKIMGLVEPRIMKSPENEALFDFALAVTSNGQAVVDNFEIATKIFRFRMRKGRFPQSKKEFNQGGERNAAMLAAFNFHNAYQRSGQNQPIRDFLNEDFTVAELRSFAEMFNEQAGFEAMKVPGSEGANVSVKGSYVLGPKIGQGFYQNIRGNYAPLTMDIWWMRMWNRVIGRPFARALDSSTMNERRNELKNLIRKTGGLPRKLVNDVLKGNDQTRTEIYQDPELFDNFIQDLERRYQRFYKEYKAEEGVNHVKPEMFKKTGTYVKNLSPKLQAAPKGVAERAYMRQVVEAARERLSESGFDITTADFQALMWYPEKQLFRALGVQPAKGSDNDYLDAAEALAEKEGISRGKIEKTLRDADRDRAINGQPSTGRQDGSVREYASRPDGQEESPTLTDKFSRRLKDDGLQRDLFNPPEEYAAAVAKGLPMDAESRKARAVEQGYRGYGGARLQNDFDFTTSVIGDNYRERGSFYGKKAPQYGFNQARKLSQYLADNQIPHKKHVARSGSAYIDVDGEHYLTRDGKKTVSTVFFRFSDHDANYGEPDNDTYLADVFPGGDTVEIAIKRLGEVGGVRSVNAVFDPEFQDSANILADIERTRADGTVVREDSDIQRVTRDSGAVDEVVRANEEAAIKPSVSVPFFNPLSEPEAQYVAKNPEDGLKPSQNLKDKFSRKKEPPLSPEMSSVIDGIASEPAPMMTPGETYIKNTESSNIQYFLDKSKQAALNKYARLERYARDPLFKDNLADTSAIAAAYFADRSMGITGSALKYGVPVYQNGVTQVKAFYHNGKKYRGLIDVMAPLYQNDHNFSLERLAQAYAIAKRAEGQRARGLKTPVPEGQLQEIEAEIAKYKNKDGVPIIEEWYEVWQAYNNKTVEFMKATGIVDDALAQKWMEMSDYVPFYRQAEAEDGEIANISPDAPVMFKRNMTSSIKLKELKGSEKAVNIPMLDAITRNLSMAIDAGMKNVAQQRIVRDMLKIGIATPATVAQRKNMTQNFVVNFKVNGVDQYYKIHDPLIYESLQSVDEMGGAITGMFGGASRWLRELVTRDPGFMAANLMRDTLSAYVTSGADFTPVVDTVAAIGKDVEDLESFGVVGGYDFSNDPEDMVEAFTEQSKKRGINVDGKNAIFNPFKKVWDWAGQGTTLSDAATRRAVYDDVLARTGNEAEAAFQALEIINFSRRGRNPAVRFLTTAIPFLNARFQGLDVLYRGFMGYNPAQKNLTRGEAALTALSRGGLITATTLMYWLMFSDSEEYKEATDEQKDLNWIFPNPFGGRPIRIPVPFEVGLIFKTIPERILDTYSVAEVFGKTGDTSDRELFESIAMRGVGSTLAINPLGVQLIGPLLEASINHNSFTNSPIVPIYVDKNGVDGLLGRESNTAISKAVGLAMDINPMKIDHVLYGYSGTIGAYVLDALDRLVLKNPAVTGKDSIPPELSIDQYPIVKRFVVSKFSSGDRQDFYRLRSEVEKVAGSLKKLEEDGRYDELEALLRAKGHLSGLSNDVNYISKNLSRLRDQRLEIERLPASVMSGKEKREAIDAILEEMSYYTDTVSELKRYADLPALSGLPLSEVINVMSQ